MDCAKKKYEEDKNTVEVEVEKNIGVVVVNKIGKVAERIEVEDNKTVRCEDAECLK